MNKNNIRIGLDVSPVCKNLKYTKEEFNRLFPNRNFNLNKNSEIYKQIERISDKCIKDMKLNEQ